MCNATREENEFVKHAGTGEIQFGHATLLRLEGDGETIEY
jgi:hypothetical protein